MVFFVPFIKIQMEQSGVRDFNEKAQENTHYIIFRDLFVLFVFFSFWFISCLVGLLFHHFITLEISQGKERLSHILFFHYKRTQEKT